MTVAIPLADVADGWLRDLARRTRSAALAGIDGATLLGERAVPGGWRIPAQVSAGGGCRLYPARNGCIALNLARPDDRDLLPALFEAELDARDEDAVAARIATRDVGALVARGRLLGLAIAAEDDVSPPPACTVMARAPAAPPPVHLPRVLDLSALWAGPLAAHLLGLAGASVSKVESRTRPDAMRAGDAAFFTRLNGGKRGIAIDLHDAQGLADLMAMIAEADIVIEAARPRALAQLGVDADAIVRATPGLTWITITGHGVTGDAAHWVGFGDDCGVAAGLSLALRQASGRSGFVGDAIADPLTGIYAAGTAWDAFASGRGGRWNVAMSGVVAAAIDTARARDAGGFDRSLRVWSDAAGARFPPVRDRRGGATC